MAERQAERRDGPRGMIQRLDAALSGRYRIERELGEGGMATVYLADDLRHGRKVAVKVLRPELAAVVGAERFLAEIKTTAALQHPHVLPLHDSGEADSFLFYVMPYIEGESLRERLDRERQLPVGEAVAIARKVASALEYAHEQGVIHRDIKPANILLSRGEPLVADFGIALALSEAGGGRITETGLSLGTPHYMSPEQAAGERTLDPRSDVYALGCVLYEMLTGEPPFPGPTAQAVLARILTGEPRRVTETRRTVPPHLDAVVARSLEKLPADRFESAEAFREALEDEGFAHEPTRTRGATPETALRPDRTPARASVYGLGLLLILALTAALFGWLRPAGEVPTVRFKVSLEPELALNFGPAFAISPDGTRLVYRGPGEQLWIRSLSSLEARPIPRTDGARTPFFSPDGQSVGYHEGQPGDDRLRTFSLSGSPPVAVVSGVAPGASWGEDGFIYFRGDPALRDDGLWRVPAAGGEPELLLPEDSTTFWFPETVPGGEVVLFTRTSSGGPSVVALDMESREFETMVAGGHPRYVGGRLFWLNPESTLMSAPFDPGSLELGAPAPVAAGIRGNVFGTGQYDVSETGTLFYQQGTAQAGEEAVWVDRQGRQEAVAPDGWPELAADPDFVSLSPDETHLALTLEGEGGGGEQHIWTYDLAQGTLNRLTVEGSPNDVPLWMPDGRTISFTSQRGGSTDLYGVSFDGSAPPVSILAHALVLGVPAWPPRGDPFLISAREDEPGGDWDLLVGRPGRDTLDSFVATEFDEGGPRLSPDGDWVAYVSNQSGQNEVYIRAFPGGGRVWTVSREGGSAPLWSRSGDELFYVNGQLELVAVEVTTTPTLSLGARESLFSVVPYEYQLQGRSAIYDVTADGQRFVFIREPGGEGGQIVVVQGLFRELDGRTRR